MECVITISPFVEWQGGESVILNSVSVKRHQSDGDLRVAIPVSLTKEKILQIVSDALDHHQGSLTVSFPDVELKVVTIEEVNDE